MNPITPVEVECEPGTVENSDGSYTATVPSGGLLILPDTTYNVYLNGLLVGTETGITLADFDINIVWQ